MYIMPNKWVEHVRAFAAKNNMSYMCAMSDPDIKKGYIATERKKQKTEKLEQAMPSTEPKPKSLVIKPRPKYIRFKEDTRPLFEGMNEKETALTKALQKYEAETIENRAKYIKLYPSGDVKGYNDKALKRLRDDIAVEFKLPTTWYSQAAKVGNKYGLTIGSKGLMRQSIKTYE